MFSASMGYPEKSGKVFSSPRKGKSNYLTMKSFSDEKMNGVLLISPFARRTTRYVPVGLLGIATYLEKQGIPASIVDMKHRLGLGSVLAKFIRGQSHDSFRMMEEYYDNVFYAIGKLRPKMVGIPCYTGEYSSVMELGRRIKGRYDTYLVAGGVHATLRPDEFIFEGSPFDFAIVGDGEKPLAKLYRALDEKDRGYKTLTGVCYFDAASKTIMKNPCYIEEDLSIFPVPDYSKIDMDFYTRPHIHNIRWLLLSGVGIFTARGCPYKCTFCATNYLRSLNKEAAKVRYRPIDQVICEIEMLKKDYKIDCFYIQDDCFMLSEERTTEFCEKLLHKKLNLIWGAETRVTYLKNEKLLQLMKKTGLVQFDVGVESGSSAMLKEIKKEISVESIKNAFDLCKKLGIRIFANVMYNLPNEREEDVRATNDLLNVLNPSAIGASITVPLLGTEIYEKYVNPKLHKDEYDMYNDGVYEKVIDSI